jgi:hypothetical protein
MRHVLVAVVRVKKHEHKVLMKAGDDTLSRSKYLCLTNPQNMTDKARAHFAQPKSAEAQDDPSVGAQAGAAGVVALLVGGMGHDILEALALIGNA